ncbi:hypothetical protein [Wolbachia endosymbiont of Laodelphax striatellus]|uniref:hypothetical protein n=1 Tax=Wolbachia endosymbiont of Laodelphax striatellus TaxID=368602 RepID=UPI00117F1AE6|nr:hypothetical protein [Wolbachia endosymbiont of Laodelphax striatellus]
MALSDNLNGKTEQQLIDDGDFINALVGKLKAGAGDNGVYTKTTAENTFLKTADLATKVAAKPVVEAIFDAKDGNDKISETKVGATFAKKTDLDNKANIDGSNATEAGVNAMLGKLTDKVLKNSELSAKVSDKAVVEAIFDAKDGNDKISETKVGATFAKKTDLDNKADANGTNLDDAKVTAILEKLTDKVVKTSELSAKAADKAVVEAIFNAQDLTDPANPINVAETKIGATFAKKTDLDNKADANGTNLDDAKVTAILEKLTDKVVKTSELSAKAADKAVVEAIFNAQDLTDPANPINVAETKIGATFAKKTDLDNKADANGTNLDDAKVTAILEKLTDKVVKTSELSAKAADKAVVEAIFNAQDLTDPANPINVAETKIGATFAKKTDLDNKADANGTNLDDAKVTAILEKLTDKVVKTSELSAKAADKAVVEAIFNAQDLTDPANPINVAETKIGATFAKKTDLDNKADANGTNLDDAKVTAILEKLTDKVVKTSELSAKAADKAVVEAIFNAQDLTDPANPINVAETKIGATFAKIDASNLTDAKNQKAFAEAILPAKDGKQSILVNKLGKALDRVQHNADDKVYGAQGSEKIAKDFLADKGLKPTPEDVATELVKNPSFQASAKIAVNAQDAGFQEAVKAVMSQPSFEIPQDTSSALSWDW